jgi:hypothetical protein
MAFESLTFQVTPSSSITDYLNRHEEVWVPWLKQQRGFIHKQIDSVRGNQVTMLLFWDSFSSMEDAYNKKDDVAILDVAIRGFSGSCNLIHYYVV